MQSSDTTWLLPNTPIHWSLCAYGPNHLALQSLTFEDRFIARVWRVLPRATFTHYPHQVDETFPDDWHYHWVEPTLTHPRAEHPSAPLLLQPALSEPKTFEAIWALSDTRPWQEWLEGVRDDHLTIQITEDALLLHGSNPRRMVYELPWLEECLSTSMNGEMRVVCATVPRKWVQWNQYLSQASEGDRLIWQWYGEGRRLRLSVHTKGMVADRWFVVKDREMP